MCTDSFKRSIIVVIIKSYKFDFDFTDKVVIVSYFSAEYMTSNLIDSATDSSFKNSSYLEFFKSGTMLIINLANV